MNEHKFLMIVAKQISIHSIHAYSIDITPTQRSKSYQTMLTDMARRGQVSDRFIHSLVEHDHKTVTVEKSNQQQELIHARHAVAELL